MHTITLSRSGHTFTASPDESVLDAATRQGVRIPYGCRNGACGSCRARLLSGGVDYPNDTLTGLDEKQRARGDVLLCQARASGDLTLEVEELDATRTSEVRTLPARVVALERVAHDVMRMSLKLPASERLQYVAGQYVEVLMRDGRRRAFSLANAPHDDEVLELHIRLVPDGAFSSYVFDGMRERALLRVHGPLGNFYLRDAPGRPAILVAGGTGLAPVKAMIEAAREAGETRPLRLYWGVRARRDLYWHEALQAWGAGPGDVIYVPVLSEPDADDAWQGRTGFVHQAVLEDIGTFGDEQVYASGPPVMVRALREGCLARGLDPDELFYDAFDYAFETGYGG